jgi:molybdopterin-guanine dinucleotide biosynthesis protein A
LLQPATSNQQPTTNNQQPTTNNQQPTTNNQQRRWRRTGGKVHDGHMETNGDCLGVVLAGGQSQRMGVDKARLSWRGQTLIARAVAMLRATGCTRVVVSGNYPEYTHVVDRYPERGPLGGLASVAEVARESRWLVSAVDQPLVDTALLRPLLDGLLVGLESARCLCRYGEEPLPMALMLSTDMRRWMLSAVGGDSGHRSLQALQERLRIHALPADAAVRARLRGVNTPDEWETLLSLG